ncbi:DUF4376 domain-containing protein [Methylomonas rapida]|uniref:DUF4376 domain-containing protein n=1 Tax=Methylomonas rapida TaxID=2963939 RepID=A0ABY7GLT2_9GAMM|nr:hypothetical protein [Methylomonas rapida]WAR43589.1 hypothetical protein NM686_014540 [Methylomonas rapida]WAR45460.1 hypothetical protein NM686_002810 [Methylomonas rapida]
MQIYHYHPVTHEVTATGVADASPLEPGVFLVPANATTIQPPSVYANQAAVFNGSAWEVVPDHRSAVYYLADGSEHRIEELGLAPPEHALFTQPFALDGLLSAIDRERNRRWRAGVPVTIGGQQKWFHSDEFSLVQHLGLKDKARDLLAAGGALSDNLTIGGLPVVWSTMDGTQVTITAQVAFDLVEAAGFQQAAIFAAAETHRAGALASATPETYDYLQDWPLVFGEAINP